MGYVNKQRDELVLFLDEGFSSEAVAERLRSAGFTVERFHHWMVDSRGQARKNVPDEEVIPFCHKKSWMIVTRDHAMRDHHRQELKRSKIAVVATAHNTSAKGATTDQWVDAFICLKPKILREYKNRVRPWFATFSRDGRMTTIETIT